MLFRRLVLCAVAIGIAAGGVLGVAEQITTAPLIAAAEHYEMPAGAHYTGDAAHHHEPAWAPEDGIERSLFTVLASIGVAIGFAVVLLVAMSLARLVHGQRTDTRTGLLWGTGAFLVVFVAPSLGLAPELPGTRAADLGARQSWWIATVALMAVVFWLLAFAPRRLGWAALVLVPLPYLLGAPAPDSVSASGQSAMAQQALAELHHSFVWATAGTNLGLWLMLGAGCGWAMQRWIAPALAVTDRNGSARA